MADGGFPDLASPRRVHLIGAGGAGMSAIGTVLLGMGHHVTGSDAVTSPALEHLAAHGATVHVGHDPAFIGDADVVARSTAIPAENPEVVEAGRRGLRVWRRSELLAGVCAQKRTAAVSGTHGKTTTTSMLYAILEGAGRHPSMVVGGEVAGLESGGVWDAAGDWLVVEADESDGTFLQLGAEAVVVTSVEPDHLDYYGSEEAMRAAFVRFLADAAGPAVVCADDPGAADLADESRRANAGRVVTYGVDPAADVVIADFESGRAGSRFSVVPMGTPPVDVVLTVPGLHNARNAAAAMTVATSMGVSWPSAAESVGRYRGVGRRFERRGEKAGVTYIDDYGHLPTEVAATLSAARSGGWDRIVAVFQPHRYSRTEALWQEFGDSFVDADVVVITDVYPAGETTRPGVTGELVVGAVRGRHPGADVRYTPTLDDAAAELRAILRAGDLCLTLGAGDLTSLPDRMLADAGD